MKTSIYQPGTCETVKPAIHSSDCHIRRLATTIQQYIHSGDDFTLDPVTVQIVEEDAWAVAIKKFETKFTWTPTLGELISDVKKKLLSIAASGERLFFGGWQQRKVFYLDLTRLISDRSEALAVAQFEQQKAIFHLRTEEESLVPRVPRRRKAA